MPSCSGRRFPMVAQEDLPSETDVAVALAMAGTTSPVTPSW